MTVPPKVRFRLLLTVAVAIAALAPYRAGALAQSSPQPATGGVASIIEAAPPVPTPPLAEFTDVLRRAGVVVQDISPSHLEGTFKDIHRAALIKTNMGFVEVAIFNTEMEAEHITITYSQTQQEVRHHYVIAGVPTNGTAGTWNSAYPVYFTLHNRWFIATESAELDAVIKRALGQLPAR